MRKDGTRTPKEGERVASLEYYNGIGRFGKRVPGKKIKRDRVLAKVHWDDGEIEYENLRALVPENQYSYARIMSWSKL